MPNPVSDALQFTVHTQALSRALGVIDATHTDGALPSILVERAAPGTSIGGSYKFPRGVAPSIAVRSPCVQNEFSFVHEVGHFIDHKALDPGAPGFATENIANNDLVDWARAVMQSPEILALRLLHAKSVSVERTQYLLDIREIWARSYTQWVAIRSQDWQLLSALDGRRRSSAVFTVLSQWEDQTFAAIYDEIDVLFTRRGWI